MTNETDKPLLTIVIANYNYGRFIESAICSVLRQCEKPIRDKSGRVVLPITGGNGSSVELIVCDAASKDNSVEVIQKYSDYLAWWCSEKDGGQSEAFNKGFNHGCGEWLTWLNADDVYYPGTLLAFARKTNSNPDAQWITGNTMNFVDATKKVAFVTWGPHYCVKFLKRNHAQMYPFGPTSFWKRSLYERLGGIDESLEYTMDLEYWARLTMAGVLQTRLNHICWVFRVHEEAKSTGKRRELKLGAVEEKYWTKKTGYYYENSFRNPWYWVWIILRVFDLSMFVRFYRRFSMIGRPVGKFVDGV